MAAVGVVLEAAAYSAAAAADLAVLVVKVRAVAAAGTAVAAAVKTADPAVGPGQRMPESILATGTGTDTSS